MRLYDSNGEPVYAEDVLDQEELAAYYNSIGHQWWKENK